MKSVGMLLLLVACLFLLFWIGFGAVWDKALGAAFSAVGIFIVWTWARNGMGI